MGRGARLIANLGDDELLASGDPPRAARPALATLARLWSLLFGADARLLPLPANAPVEEEPQAPPWPEALGARPDDPVFQWIPAADALVPWIATPGLWTQLAAAGRPIAAAAPEIVARVHDKAFAHRVACREGLLPRALVDLVTVLDPDELRDEDRAVARMSEALSRWPEPTARSFCLKPRFGTSGRGRVAGVAGEVDTAAIRGALPRLAERGGAILEPWFARSCDLSAQLFIDAGGAVTLLGTLEQIVAPSGLFLGHRGEIDSRGRVFSGSAFDESLRGAAPLVAVAAAAEGFHGPCGLDAFAMRLPGEAGEAVTDRELLRPVVELNARYTVGTVAIGLVRLALDAIRQPLSLEPGCRRAFVFALDAPSGGWEAAAASAGPGALLLPLFHTSETSRPALLFAASSGQLDESAARIAQASR